MGCDIHGWVETRQDGKWIAISELHDQDRNYGRFARLAGVRNYNGVKCEKRLGIPADVSETTKYHIDRWGVDGHSHSYMEIKKAAGIFNETAAEPCNWPIDRFFDVGWDDELEGEYRLVFWFDN